MFGEAHALGQNEAEAIEERGLGGVGLSDAAQADLTVEGGWQHDVMRLNAREFFEHGAGGVSETGAALPHLQALPQNEGEEADEDVGLHTLLALMPDRPDVQLILLDAEGGFDIL